MKKRFNPLWVEAYRPSTLSECVLPSDIRTTLEQYVAQGTILNTLVSGSPGIGKTTVLKAMVEQIGSDYIFVNGSLNGNIDTLRNQIQEFASTVSFAGGRKYVILDEADNLTMATQLALRSFIEAYSNTGFLLSCNYPHKIEEALRSRMAHIEFRIPKEEKPRLAKAFFENACNILKAEGVEYDNAVVAEVIKRYFPDFRKVLMELQRYSATSDKKIDSGILAKMQAGDLPVLLGLMKSKNFTGVRKWIGENSDSEMAVYRKIYENAKDIVTPDSVAPMVLILAEYEYRSAFVADKEINMAACLAQIMAGVAFK